MAAPIILIISLTLYLSAIIMGAFRGPDTFIVGLLAGCASISMGVWVGVELNEKPDLLNKNEKEDE